MSADKDSYSLIDDGKRVMKFSYNTARSLGSMSRWVYDSCAEVGNLVGEGIRFPVKLLSGKKGPGTQPEKKPVPKGSLIDQEIIRHIVIEELTRIQGESKDTAICDIEGRLMLMANTLEAMRGQIDELHARGPISEADAWKTMQAIQPAGHLSHDEQALLVNIFRRNMALQKPQHEDTPDHAVVSS